MAQRVGRLSRQAYCPRTIDSEVEWAVPSCIESSSQSFLCVPRSCRTNSRMHLKRPASVSVWNTVLIPCTLLEYSTLCSGDPLAFMSLLCNNVSLGTSQTDRDQLDTYQHTLSHGATPFYAAGLSSSSVHGVQSKSRSGTKVQLTVEGNVEAFWRRDIGLFLFELFAEVPRKLLLLGEGRRHRSP